MKKVVFALLAFLMIFAAACEKDAGSSAPEELSSKSEESAVSEEIIDFDGYTVTVLGDSIAYGYGLKDAENERFSALFEKLAEQNGGDMHINNFSVNGMTGSGLAELLRRSGDAHDFDDQNFTEPDNDFGVSRSSGYEFSDQDISNLRCSLLYSDAVFISIGGNNILSRLFELGAVGDIVNDAGEEVFADYFAYIQAPDDNLDKAYSVKKLESIFAKLNEAFSGEKFISLIESAQFSLSEELWDVTQTIKEMNPDAEIYLQTVYNPYSGIKLELSLVEGSVDLSSYGENAVAHLNRAIFEEQNVCKYTIVDVKDAFYKADETLTNAGYDFTVPTFSVDPHPNKAGHEVIAKLYFDVVSEARR